MNEQLMQYVRDARTAGSTDADIEKALLDAGWASADVDSALGIVRQQPAPTPPPSAPVKAMPQYEYTQMFPFAPIGLVALMLCFVVSYFTLGVASVVISIATAPIAFGVLLGLAKLFRVEGKLSGRTLFILGITNLFGAAIQALSKFGLLSLPVMLVLFLATFVGGLFLLKMTYRIGWGKTIGIFISDVVASVVLFVLSAMLLVTLSFMFLAGGLSSSHNIGGITGRTTLTDGAVLQPGTSGATTQKVLTRADIHTFQTIELGTYPDTEALRSAILAKGYTIDMFAKPIFDQKAFTVASKRSTVDLVLIHQQDLSPGKGSTLGEIYASAEALGLQLCPAEVGPQLLLQSLGGASDVSSVNIAMEQTGVTDSSGKPESFSIFSISFKSKSSPFPASLNGGIGSPGSYAMGTSYIFCNPPK